MKSESIVALVFAVYGTALFTILLVFGKIESVSYVALLTILYLACLALHGFSRIRELDLKNLKITLDKIREVRKDIYAKEKDLRLISIQLAKILAFTATFQGRYGGGSEKKREWYRTQTTLLLHEINVDETTWIEIKKFDDLLSQVKEDSSTEEKEKIRDEVDRLIQSDIEKSNAVDPHNN